MKRKLLHFLMLLIVSSLTASFSSCRSSKKSGGMSHGYHKEELKKRKLRNDKNGKGSSKTGKKIAEEAMTWEGTPYGYGKAEKGKACDCSGMVMSVYEKVTGIKLPRNSAQQQDFCKDLRKKDVLVGDLCFFATGKDPDRTSHVGIMIDECNFIHASTSKGVVVSDITQPYWVRTFKGFGRVPDQ